ncbi:hypothetical protein BDC45DRAFT_546622 [Circinella umbellata]|nr:hypothetical protein BDC45DRAFT_546622 [Circinella umbellata]
MENEASSSEEKYKVVEYNEQIFRIPVRRIHQSQYLFLSDVQAIVPAATALTSTDKLIPFETDPTSHEELVPKRVSVTEFSSAWQVHVPENIESRRTLQAMDKKLDRLSRQLRRLLIQPPSLNQLDHNNNINNNNNCHDNSSHDNESDSECDDHAHSNVIIQEQQDTSVDSQNRRQVEQPLIIRHNNNNSNNDEEEGEEEEEHHDRPESPPPAFTTSPLPTRRLEGDAPPSYETSILGNIKSLTDQLRLYESHIANRHKSPRWLARRQDWIDREPSSIEQVAYQLVQLEMALLWTAVSESWIQERETWLTLVASARTERHLAGAMLNLERHTLVMDDAWVTHARETWTNELLEMIVLPLTHG